MDGYIKKSEAVDVIVKYPYNIAGKTATAIKMIEDLPSADVVPKSEVEKFAEEIKLEFYREFDEIIPSIMADKIDDLKKKYTKGKMIENNFTDDQVIKALECCEKGGACTSCTLKDDYSPCSSSMAHLALSLINKQKNDLNLLKSTITHKEEEAYNKGYADAKKSILRDIKAIMQIIILDYKEIGAFDNAEIVGYVRDHLIAELEKRYTEGVKKE